MAHAVARRALAWSLTAAAALVGVALFAWLGAAPRELDASDVEPEREAPPFADAAASEREEVERAAASVPELDASSSQTEIAGDAAVVPYSYWGRVIDAETKTPIVGARVEQWGSESWRNAAARTISDIRGLFELRLPEPDGLQVLVHAPGFSAVSCVLRSKHASAETALEIALARSAQIEAHVRDHIGTALADAEVRLTQADRFAARTPLNGVHPAAEDWGAITDAFGIAQLVDLPAETALTVELRLGNESARFSDIVLARGEQRVLELALGAGSRVSGWLVAHDGRALSGHELWLTNSLTSNWKQRASCLFEQRDAQAVLTRVASDALGHFEFASVPAGRWWIGPAPNSAERRRMTLNAHGVDDNGTLAPPDPLEPCALATQIDVDGATPLKLSLQVRCGLYIRGRVLDPRGEPRRASVQAHGVDVGGRIDAELDAEGNFLLGPLPEARFALWADGASDWADSEQLVVVAGAQDVELRLRELCNFVGRVTGIDSNANECRAFVVNEVGIAYFHVRGDGSFEVRSMAAGRYDLIASTASGLFGVVRGARVEAGASAAPLEIALRPGTRLTVSCKGNPAPARVKVYDGDGLVEFDTLAPDTASVFSVPAGRLRIEVRPDEVSVHTREVDARAGQVASVEFQLD